MISKNLPILNAYFATKPPNDASALERRIALLQALDGNPELADITDAIFECALDDAAADLVRL
jgi:hypothetical protein